MTSDTSVLYGGIEAGGTKFVCAVGSGPDDIRATHRFPTTTPDETLIQAQEFFAKWHAETPLRAIGIAAFGPVDPTPGSKYYGHITTTPKPHWAHTDVVGRFADQFGIPIAFDSDVNGAALGEHTWGAAQGLDTFVYLTVGTGIGGGGMVGGKLLHGLMHPEMGHMLLPHDLEIDPFPGWCPYHGDCLEGLAAGPAIEKRWGTPASQLPPDHAAWALEAHYLALGLANITLVLSPQRIILGGGVMDQTHLYPAIRTRLQEILNGYIQKDALAAGIDEFVVPPGLGNRAGVLGSIALAITAARSAEV